MWYEYFTLLVGDFTTSTLILKLFTLAARNSQKMKLLVLIYIYIYIIWYILIYLCRRCLPGYSSTKSKRKMITENLSLRSIKLDEEFELWRMTENERIWIFFYMRKWEMRIDECTLFLLKGESEVRMGKLPL